MAVFRAFQDAAKKIWEITPPRHRIFRHGMAGNQLSL
jgi:uncharacterized BrkB/YihY/UPF0761 family membrane protein